MWKAQRTVKLRVLNFFQPARGQMLTFFSPHLQSRPDFWKVLFCDAPVAGRVGLAVSGGGLQGFLGLGSVLEMSRVQFLASMTTLTLSSRCTTPSVSQFLPKLILTVAIASVHCSMTLI